MSDKAAMPVVPLDYDFQGAQHRGVRVVVIGVTLWAACYMIGHGISIPSLVNGGMPASMRVPYGVYYTVMACTSFAVAFMGLGCIAGLLGSGLLVVPLILLTTVLAIAPPILLYAQTAMNGATGSAWSVLILGMLARLPFSAAAALPGAYAAWFLMRQQRAERGVGAS